MLPKHGEESQHSGVRRMRMLSKSLLCSSLVASSAFTTTPLLRTVANSGRRLRTFALHASALADNPLMAQGSLPRFGAIETVHVKPAVEETLSTLESEFAALEAKLAAAAAPGYGDVVESLEKLEAVTAWTRCWPLPCCCPLLPRTIPFLPRALPVMRVASTRAHGSRSSMHGASSPT